MPFRIQFVTNWLNPISAAVRFRETSGWASHVELIDTDKKITLGARARSLHYPGGIQIRECKYDHYSRVKQFVLNSSQSPELLGKMWSWMLMKKGTPYNYLGITGILFDINIQNAKAMDCSESIFLASWQGADFPLLSTRSDDLPWKIAPPHLMMSRGLVYVPNILGY